MSQYPIPSPSFLKFSEALDETIEWARMLSSKAHKLDPSVQRKAEGLLSLVFRYSDVLGRLEFYTADEELSREELIADFRAVTSLNSFGYVHKNLVDIKQHTKGIMPGSDALDYICSKPSGHWDREIAAYRSACRKSL